MDEEEVPRSDSRAKTIVLVAVAVVFSVLLGLKIGGSLRPPASSPTATTSAGATTHASVDAVAAFDAARSSGKPVFLSFGSATCPTCAQMKKVVDKVVPEYQGEVVYVSAVTSDPSGKQLASQFTFQYIPASFFIAPDGSIVDSYTGALDEKRMRTYLNTLVSHQ
jgi:thioredoxin-like negative regulator of GroEL